MAIVYKNEIRIKTHGAYEDLIFGFLALEDELKDNLPVPFEVVKSHVKENYRTKESEKTRKQGIFDAFSKASKGGKNV